MVFWVLVVVIGVLAGVATPAAWWLLQTTNDWLIGEGPWTGASVAQAVGLPLGVAVALALFFGLWRSFRSADGFTYFISDLHFQDGRRKLRYSVPHGIGSMFLLFGKGVVGLEAAGMEILSALGSWAGQRAGLSANQVRTLTACGATAAIAAVLGQPTAAFLFVVELLYGWGSISFTVGAYALTAFVAASVSQSLTSAGGWFGAVASTDSGLAHAIRTDNFEISPLMALALVPAVTVAAGLFGSFTIWLHQRTDAELHRLFGSRRGQDVTVAAFLCRAGFWAGLTAVALLRFPQVAGTGTELLQEALSQGISLPVIAAALFVRVLLGAAAYSVMGTMGLVLPTLVAGALLGAGLSALAHPVLAISPGTVALLGMGAYFSACFGTPVAATALVFGYASGLMTDSALLLFTSLLANFGASYLCGRLQGDRLATIGLYRHGIRFRSGMCYNTLSGIQVRDAMVTYVDPLPRLSSIGEAYKRLMESKFSTLPVVDEAGKMRGIVSLADFYGLDTWKRLGAESQVHSLVGVEEMLKPARVQLRADMNLEGALMIMSDEELAPVVDEEGKYAGLLVKTDLVNLYNKEVVKKAFRRV